MTVSKFVGLGLALSAGLVLATSLPAAGEKTPPDPVRIGMVQSLFADIPAPVVQILTGPFNTLMKKFTGMNGQIAPGGDFATVGKAVQEEKLHLAVFHGLEYAWAQARYPDLKPLMVAVNRHRHVRAHFVVRKDNLADGFVALKDKVLALPRRSKDHCKLFLERHCSECGHMAQVTEPANVEVALDEVCLGKIDCACVDTVALETYQELKPGCFARLRVLKHSENFPAGVIAYRQGAMDEGTLKRFRDGLIDAKKTAEGQQMMQLWNITSFEPVPEDYQHTVTEILKVYPPPETSTSKVSTTTPRN